ncbi:hypothetical protein H4R24_004536 [Coemansia sp. RSA 988]|nr:hypothetical protein H4R24_004536 [Coemansia sp. RSA 988]
MFFYTFDLPKDLPSSDKAIFAWTWVNASGNREFYMNCAVVSITGTSNLYTGKIITIANYDGYPTIPEFNLDYETWTEYYMTNAKNTTVKDNGSTGDTHNLYSAKTSNSITNEAQTDKKSNDIADNDIDFTANIDDRSKSIESEYAEIANTIDSIADGSTDKYTIQTIFDDDSSTLFTLLEPGEINTLLSDVASNVIVEQSIGSLAKTISKVDGKNGYNVYEKLKHCFFKGPSSTSVPEVSSYTFDLPKDLPASDKAIFAWTWSNASGNREFYMNCADVSISGTSKSFTGKNITVVNYGPSSPKVPEFANDYDAPLKYYTENQKYLTVSGDGSVTSGTKPAGGTPGDDDAGSSDGKDTVDGAASSDDMPTEDDSGTDTDTSSMDGNDSGTADAVSSDSITSNDYIPASDAGSEAELADPLLTSMTGGSTVATPSATNTDIASIAVTDTSATLPTTMPTSVITATPSTMYTSIVSDSNDEEGTKPHGGMCCQNCCGCNGGFNGGWFPGMQNMGGYQQYGYYGPGYMVPNPGMDTVNNYYYENGNNGGQGVYPGGGVQGGQFGYQFYGQVGSMQPTVTNNYQMFGPTVNAQQSNPIPGYQ